jgi:hypothetical protein
MEQNEDPGRLIRRYEEMLGAVRAVADRLRARFDELRARYPDELTAGSGDPAEDGAESGADTPGTDEASNPE